MASTGKTVTRKSPAKPAAKAAPVASAIAADPVLEAVVAPVVDTVVETQAALPAPVAEKEEANMVEQLKTTAQTAFTQATDKARETIEKTVKTFEEAGEFTKGNVEALVASTKAATAGVETLAQGAADFSKKSFEAGSAHLKTLAATRTPADAFKLQNDFAKSQFDGLVAEMSRSTEAMMKIMGDVFEPLSNRFALAAEKAKTAVLTR